MYTDNKQINKYLSIWLGSMFMIVSLMIVVGGLTRLTDSGLSITEWELFSGIFPPLNDSQWSNYFDLYKMIPEYKLQNYLMSLEEFKFIFWWEWLHRFLGRLIGLSFLLQYMVTYAPELKKLYVVGVTFYDNGQQYKKGYKLIEMGESHNVENDKKYAREIIKKHKNITIEYPL